MTTRLCMTLLVRDEETLLRLNIEYHLSRGVDLIIATDNRSVDRTADILREYERAGLLVYIYESGDDYSQDLWVTRMARMAAEEYNADWIFHVDADEFWWPRDNRSIKSILDEVPSSVDGLSVQRYNFAALRHLRSDSNFYQEMIYREVASYNALGRPLPPKVMHRSDPGIFINQGNHSFTHPLRKVRTQSSDALAIWHFPHRSFASFQSRIEQGGRAYCKNTRLPQNAGRTWRELWKLKQRGGLWDHFQQLALDEYTLQKRIDDGSLVVDTRFREYILDTLPSV